MRLAAAGAAALLAGMLIGLGAGASHVPTGHLLGPLARIVEVFAPWLLGFGLGAAGCAGLWGLRRAGAALALLAGCAGLWLWQGYRAQTVPLATGAPEIEALFFNIEGQTEALDAVLTRRADIVVLAEAEALVGALDPLRAAYAFVSPCEVGNCELVVASNLPVTRFWQRALNRAWPARYAVAELDWNGRPVFLAASHLVKPWMQGLAEPELAQLIAQVNWFDGPVFVLGDFNMPPWSRPMQQLLSETGVRASRAQPGSWPISGGMFRLPIDQILTRDGVDVVDIAPFGEDLGSNHRGFVAGLRLHN